MTVGVSARAGPSSRSGLSSAAARRLLDQHGANVLAEPEPPHWVLRFARNLTHLFALLLWTGAALAAVGGMPELSAAIVGVIIVNAVFSFVQEHRAERAVDALRRILPHRVRVRRDGRLTEVDAEAIVPGDLVLLSAGDRVPADAHVVWDAELRVDESTLTGESEPVQRRSGESVFAGTHVTAGAAEVGVTATAMRTELGRITALTVGTHRHDSPLQVEMRRITRLVAIISVFLGAAFFLLAGSLGMDANDRFLFAIGVIVANVPEGLLPTVTLSLAMATQRMARRNAIVRRLSAVETLGETTVICTDKTGTLTANQMTVRRVWTAAGEVDVSGVGYEAEGEVRVRTGARHDPVLEELARAVALCNDASLERRENGLLDVIGDPTEGALLTLARKLGLDPEQEAQRLPREHVLPFDSAHKRMTTFHQGVAYVKGAPGAVLAHCAIDETARATAHVAAEAMAREALRVLAVARRALPDGDLQLLGLVGMEDPPRPQVGAAINRCRHAGIRLIMVTGDHAATAEAIARETGLIEGPPRVLQGAEIDRLDDAGLLAELQRTDVLVARVTPEQKLRIARTLRQGGEVVAMTGDGVNDAPALQEADIGIAMGRGGTDVAREAADLVLVDDDFASIAAAVEEGRAVYDNIRRFAQYHFSSNVAELCCFLAWGLSGGAIPLPLVVMQVLAIDLGTDLLPAIALGTEPPEAGTMERPPRPRSERLLNARVLGRVYGFVGLIVGAAGLTSFLASYWLAGWQPFEPLPESGTIYVQATAMAYAGIVAGQVGAGLAFRTNRLSVFAIGLFSNRFLVAGIAFEIALLLAFLYLPPLQGIFHTEPIDPRAWLLLAVWPGVVLGAEEVRKALVRRRNT